MTVLPDAAARLAARGELRRRWKSFALLGLLIGIVAGLAGAGVTGARRSAVAYDRLQALSPEWDIVIVPNDPAFGPAQRGAIAALPGVAAADAFSVVPLLVVIDDEPRPEIFSWLQPVPEDYGSRTADQTRMALVAGRRVDPNTADEAVVSEGLAHTYDVALGDVVELEYQSGEFGGEPTPDGIAAQRFALRVVGIARSPDDAFVVASPAFLGLHLAELSAIVNLGIFVEPGVSVDEFQVAAAEAANWPGLPIIDGVSAKRDTRRATQTEASGLWLFAAAVLIGGGTLVGQALVRAVGAGGADESVFAALGMRLASRRTALVLPATVSACVAAGVAPFVSVALSPIFPIGLSRNYVLREGVHVDLLVLALATVLTPLAVLVVAGLSAWWTTRAHQNVARSPKLSGAALRAGLPVPVAIGLRLAFDPGRGQRAIPVRTALIGAVAGVLGLVGAFTFRSGIDEALAHPERAGVNADAMLSAEYGAEVPDGSPAVVRDDPAVSAAVQAVWWRSLPIGSAGAAVWTFQPLVGEIPVTVLRGRLPVAADEVAVAPLTMRSLDTHVGDRLPSGENLESELVVVGEVLLPEESHQGYRGGALMTPSGAVALGPAGGGTPGVDRFDGFIVRWQAGADVEAAFERLGSTGLEVAESAVPANLTQLDNVRSLPFWLGLFLAVLAVTTVAHALATTVRRRRHEIAVLAALGVSARQTRLSIAVQATMLAVVGLVLGVPLGVAGGRLLWRSINNAMSFLYVAPLAVSVVVVVWPAVVALANVIAAAPARAAARIRPAVVLRAE